jgi:threonine/homoserine/homoserine lactone efflux protein
VSGGLLQGVALGLAVAAPVGPIGLLCIQRSIEGGFLAGFATGLGAATADTLYGLLAALGMFGVTQVLGSGGDVLRLVGAGFLLWLAVSTWRSVPAEPGAAASVPGPAACYLTTVVLTLANPATILSFAAIFAGLGVGTGDQSPLPLVIGVAIGSALWWLGLAGAVSGIRSRLGHRLRRAINRGSAVLLGGFAVAALWPLLGLAGA